MSVSDPLIKDMKGCILAFLQEIKINRSISDTNSILLVFCQSVERIFSYGLITTHNKLGFAKCIDPWVWLEKIIHDKNAETSYSYTDCVQNVKLCRNVFTNVGKLRLLIRFCLIRKCLHAPVEYLKTSKKINTTYKENSLIGDEILCEIILSLLRQCSKIPFKLDVSISSFLDISWNIPEVLKLEFVPCNSLGMTVSFSGEKAVIASIKSNSVVSENGKVEVGDILDTLNEIYICSATKGRLSSILKSSKGRPVALTIIKAVYGDSRQIYMPIINILKEVELDPDVLRSRVRNCGVIVEEGADKNQKLRSPGYKVNYMGFVQVGSKGDVKQIDKAVNILLAPGLSLAYDDVKFERCKKSVFFEMTELGVKCVDKTTSEVLLKHSFMEISSCGSVLTLPNYFAYIAGDKYCNMAKSFTCYIFFTKHPDTAYTILQSIGQGFQRTHFAV